jgi:hypothetical protein
MKMLFILDQRSYLKQIFYNKHETNTDNYDNYDTRHDLTLGTIHLTKEIQAKIPDPRVAACRQLSGTVA